MTDARLQLAADALNRGNGHRALEHLADVNDQFDPGVLQLRSAALSSVGHHSAAEDTARRGLEVAPEHVGLRLTLADILVALDRHADAEAALISILNRDPEDPVALRQYAWLLAQAGDAQGARSIVARLPDPEHDPALLALHGYIAMIEGKPKQAGQFLDRGLALAPEAAGVRMLRALDLSLNDRPREAIDQMRAAAALDPKAAGAMGRQARYVGHPLMAPIRWASRIGVARIWIVWIVVLFSLPRVWPSAPMVPIVLVYLAFAIYSWTVPFLLRKWLQHRGQL